MRDCHPVVSGVVCAAVERMNQHRTTGFTLVELVVVIAIILLVMALLMPVLAPSRERARRIVCMSQLRQIAVANFTRAGDRAGAMDLLDTPGGKWLWDIAFQDYTNYLAYGLTRPLYYCPASPQNDEVHWDFHGVFRVTGYMWAMRRTTGGWSAFETSLTDFLPAYVDHLSRGQPAKQVLLADAIVSDLGSNDFFRVFGDAVAPGYSSHLDSAHRPTGANVTFADGHNEWRDWPELKSRLVRSSNALHWW